MTYCPPLYSYGNAHQTKRPISHSGVPGQHIIITTIARKHHTHQAIVVLMAQRLFYAGYSQHQEPLQGVLTFWPLQCAVGQIQNFTFQTTGTRLL